MVMDFRVDFIKESLFIDVALECVISVVVEILIEILKILDNFFFKILIFETAL